MQLCLPGGHVQGWPLRARPSRGASGRAAASVLCTLARPPSGPPASPEVSVVGRGVGSQVEPRVSESVQQVQAQVCGALATSPVASLWGFWREGRAGPAGGHPPSPWFLGLSPQRVEPRGPQPSLGVVSLVFGVGGPCRPPCDITQLIADGKRPAEAPELP